MNIKYIDDLSHLSSEQLAGFFVGCPHHPDTTCHLKILRASYKVWIAMNGEQCIGFINAISDGMFSAFIPFLEVLPEYQGKGIGSELVRKIVTSLDHIYAVDIVCDEKMADFYEAQGFSRLFGMARRNYANQNGTQLGK